MWNLQNFMTRKFDCTGFVTAYMTCVCCNNTFERFKNCTYDNLICLSAASEKINIGIWFITGIFYFCDCDFAIFIAAISCKIF